MPIETLSRPEPAILAQFVLAAGVALAAALPVGPVSILAVQRALAHGFWRAFWPTLGAVLADGLFGLVAAVGAGQLSSAILDNKPIFRIAGAVLLAGAGI